jgi:hypothetical protein
LFEGEPGQGKHWIAATLATASSRGQGFPQPASNRWRDLGGPANAQATAGGRHVVVREDKIAMAA